MGDLVILRPLLWVIVKTNKTKQRAVHHCKSVEVRTNHESWEGRTANSSSQMPGTRETSVHNHAQSRQRVRKT